jgi:hypothetical protein
LWSSYEDEITLSNQATGGSGINLVDVRKEISPPAKPVEITKNWALKSYINLRKNLNAIPFVFD